MKDRNRIRFNGHAAPSGKQGDEKTEIFEPAAKLDRALRALPVEELKKALREITTVCLQVASETNAVNLDSVIHKNFFQINMGQREQKELRKLAAAFGVELRDFLTSAIRGKKYEYKEMMAIAEGASINPQFVYSLTTSRLNNN